jgi:metallophosphoesterase superfamily enzyme
MIIINDVHIGFRRTGGTTPASQEALRTYLFNNFRKMVNEADADDLVILGDLFDDFEVSPRDWVETFVILVDHLRRGGGLILVAGNHDWSPKGNRVSSFQMLAEVLCSQFSDSDLHVVGIDEYMALGGRWYLAHCSNQSIFETKLKEIWDQAQKGDIVYLHANYDNNFAAQTDHSLNVDRKLADNFASKDITLVFAHEHQARRDNKHKVVVLGNQWPTSIIDCLGNDKKFAHLDIGGLPVRHKTWDKDSDVGYTEVNWRDLKDSMPTRGFVRVVGHANANEASDVVNSIAKFRKDAPPEIFVVGNAVKVAGITEAADLPESFEAAKRFDVMDYINQHLDKEEAAAVQELMKEVK